MDQLGRLFFLFALQSILIFSPTTYAIRPFMLDPNAYVVMLSAGPGWVGNHATQNISFEPDLDYGFDGRSTSKTLLNGEIFLGFQHFLTKRLQGELGLAFAGSSNAQFYGDVWVDANPNLNDFNYQFNIDHAHVSVKEKVLFQMLAPQDVIPYVSGSIGVGFNYSHHFQITPKIYEQLPPTNFNANTTTALTYTLGVGLQKILSAHWQVGVGYDFADWGKSQFDRAPEQQINTGLTLSHVYIHALMVNVTYLH